MWCEVSYHCRECGHSFRMVVPSVKRKDKLALKAQLICPVCHTEMEHHVKKLRMLYQASVHSEEKASIYFNYGLFLYTNDKEIVLDLDALVASGFTGKVILKLRGESLLEGVSCPAKSSLSLIHI